MFHIPEQDSTDLEKCLRSVTAPWFLGLGFLGGRIDHELAALNALVRYRSSPVILLGSEDLCFRLPPSSILNWPRACAFRYFPWDRLGVTGACGLRWEVNGLEFAPDGRIGTSNEALGGPIQLEVDRPVMIGGAAGAVPGGRDRALVQGGN